MWLWSKVIFEGPVLEFGEELGSLYLLCLPQSQHIQDAESQKCLSDCCEKQNVGLGALLSGPSSGGGGGCSSETERQPCMQKVPDSVSKQGKK